MKSGLYAMVAIASASVSACAVADSSRCEDEGIAVVCNTVVVYLDVPEAEFEAASTDLVNAFDGKVSITMSQPPVRRLLLDVEHQTIPALLPEMRSLSTVRYADYLPEPSFSD